MLFSSSHSVASNSAISWIAARQASLSITNSQFTQTHVHQVGDAIQPSHPLLSPSPPAPNPSQHQGLFQWVNSWHEVAKVLEFFSFSISPSNEHPGLMWLDYILYWIQVQRKDFESFCSVSWNCSKYWAQWKENTKMRKGENVYWGLILESCFTLVLSSRTRWRGEFIKKYRFLGTSLVV